MELSKSRKLGKRISVFTPETKERFRKFVSDAYQKKRERVRQRYGIDPSLFASAETSGVDPRTVKFLEEKSEKVLEKSLRKLTSTFISMANEPQADIKAQLESEKRRMVDVQAIRERRKKAVTEVAKKLTRSSKSGVGALLSDRGGQGFFTRYFKA